MSYIGQDNSSGLLGGTPRYFYGLRRTDAGDLYIQKVDMIQGSDSVTINNAGDSANNFIQFAEGVDFFEGRDVNHNLVFGNLNYEQYRWADANINYYLDQTTGQFVARVNQAYSYPAGV